MAKWGMILAVAAVGTAGCTPSYRVHVNTFLESGEAVSQGSSIRVAIDPNTPNPILAKQIESKITQLLDGYGYRTVQTPETADYLLTFQAGIDSQRNVDYVPMYRPFGGFYGRYYGGYYGRWGFGYTTYLPYIDTVYIHWLRMRLEKLGNWAGQGTQVVWIGDALVGMDGPELREAINYLLVACMQYFPIDTGQWRTVTIKEDDPRLLDILGIQPGEPAQH
jgi:hypothetical protein